MAVAGSVDVALDIFGGLVTDMAPADLPAGVSPDCQDVAFVPGSVKTRPGLLSIFTPVGGAVNYLKTYIPPTGFLRLLALDAAGSLWKESSVGVLSLVKSGIVANSYGKSTSLFTREYLAIGDGKYGIDIPRQFDDTNFDRVSQVGPGAAPNVTDEAVSQATTTESQPSTVAISTATENGFLVTITTTAAHGLVAGQNVVVAGVGIAGYNNGGTNPAVFQVLTVPSTTTFTYILGVAGLASSSGGTVQSALATYNFASAHGLVVGQLVTTSGITPAGYNVTALPIFSVPSSTSLTLNLSVVGLAAGGAGTMANAGNVSVGVHKLSVVFKTRQGYLTAPAPPTQWTAGGGKRAVVSNIPTGPSNVIARILIFTAAGQSFFFYSSGIQGIFSSNFIVSDNTTTNTVVDFTDLGLTSGINADSLFKLLELGECAGVIDYGSRLFWWGERNKVQNFNNLSFDGGGGTFPLGWTFGGIGKTGNGGALVTSQLWGQAYQITVGSGATSGAISQSAYQDSNGVPILQPNTAYSVRARYSQTAAPVGGSVFHIKLTSVSAGISTTGLTTTITTSSAPLQEIIASLTDAPIATIPSDLALEVYVSGAFSNGAVVTVDNIEVFPTNQPFNSSVVRASKVEDAESYDGVTGFLNVSENDGYAVRSAFVIRENLYFVKEHGIYVTQDDGNNEPNQWKITEVSRKVGTPSINGVSVGEDWAVIADRTGLYVTTGGEPRKISQEIQPTWDRINWAAGQTLWVQVDIKTRRIYVGVPLDTATSPSNVLMLDYRGTNTVEDLITAGPIHTTYTGKLIVLEKSRKWSPWTISANYGALIERFDGTQQMFLGNGVGNGKIYQLSDSQLTDDGVAIPGYYQTYFHYSHELEQMFQVGSHNKLFNYISQFVEGNGQLVVSAVSPGASPITIASLTLSNPALRDTELPINVTAVRAAFRIATSNPGEWFRLARFIVNAIKHPSAPIRGWN